jgi:hypothetical protein
VILPISPMPDEYADRSEHLALVHISRAQELLPDSSSRPATTG